MGIFQQFPYSNFHDMNMDWLLNKMKQLEKEMADFFLNIDDKIKDDVDEWLDDHPEATTTVMDHSISSLKFSDSVPFYNVADYGILPNSGDVYEALHDLISDRVYYTGGILFFPKGTYTISYTVFIPENTIVLGEGEESIIYFDESDTFMGVGMCNAGSNVTFENIKFAQKSKGTFHTNAQPGCAAFSDIHKEQVKVTPYSHYIIRGDAKNLTARNLYFDGFYAFQTENSEEHTIENIIYENLYAPNSCVSAMASTKGIKNIIMNNINCDLLRINANVQGGKIDNVLVNNTECTTFIFGSQNSDTTFIINNLIQKTSIRKNDILASTLSGAINTNIKFNNCIFNCVANETAGIQLFNGIREFHRCVFNCIDRAIIRENAISDTTNYEIMNECTFNFSNRTNPTILLGYGENNKIDRTGNAILLWGDIYSQISSTRIFSTAEGASSSFVNRIKCLGDVLKLEAYLVISNTNNIATLTNEFRAFDIDGSQFPVTIFNGNDQTTRISTWATIENGVIKVKDPAFANSTQYNRAIIDAIIPINSTPTPTALSMFA